MIRTGEDYRNSINDGRDVWINGARVDDPCSHPQLKPIIDVRARIYDMQHAAETQEAMTYEDAGERFAIGLRLPYVQQDWQDKRDAVDLVTRDIGGVVTRMGDETIGEMWSLWDGKDILNEIDPRFAKNIERHIRQAIKADPFHVSANTDPKGDRSKAPQDQDPDMLVHVVKETDAGIIVKGARLLATLGPLSDEIEVFPSTLLRADDSNIPFAFAFAIPIATPGLKMICRDSYDHGKSHFDAPLSSRYEEMDAVVIFDNVLVPWERVFMYGEPNLCNQAFAQTNAVVHMAHQVAYGKLAKAEFMVGVMCAIAKVTGRDKDLATKGMIAEVMLMAETVRALLFSAEQQAHEDQWGNFIPLRGPLDASRNLFPKMYPRMVEILQLLGSSSLMATPTEADFSNAMAGDVEKYFQLTHMDSRDRVGLYRLAHDIAVSGFGNRQALYERFFFGPPQIMSSVYFDGYDKDSKIDRVENLLAQAQSS